MFVSPLCCCSAGHCVRESRPVFLYVLLQLYNAYRKPSGFFFFLGASLVFCLKMHSCLRAHVTIQQSVSHYKSGPA